MKRARKVPIVLACLGAAALAVPVAQAHFNLMQPTNWVVQNGSGDPQKQAPCGNEGIQNPTNAVATFKAGDKVPITLLETTPHPGHYRVSLAATQAALPMDPPVTPDMQSECGSTPITNTPTLPLLADGLLPHTAATPLIGPKTVMVQLPANMTCDHCVLQIQEFMSSHGAPCFYHHCAIVNITQDGTPPPPGVDAGVNGDAAIGGSPGTTSGGCAAGGGSALAAGLILGIAVLRLRRRGRPHR